MTSKMKDYLNPKTIVAEVRMTRSKNKGQTYILVEGESDIAFYKNIVEKSNCKIKYCNGKDKVLEAIDAGNRAQLRGVIGIIDKDFDDLLNREIQKDNLFITDTHDLETLILQTNAFERFNNEFGDDYKIESFEKIHGLNVFDKIKKICSRIGKARLSSIKNNFNLTFNDLKLDDFMDDNLDFKFEDYIKNVIYYSKQILNRDIIEKEIHNEEKQEYDIWQICRGHDFAEIIAVYYSNSKRCSVGNEKAKYIRSNVVERELRLAYELTDFYKTSLFKKIYDWQMNNKDMIILKIVECLAA